jgi:hypothetical protein
MTDIPSGLAESRMRGNAHVRFGRRAGETDQPKSWHRAPTRPHTLAWLTKCRLLDRDYEPLPAHAEADVQWAMIGLVLRRLEPEPGRRPWQKRAA